MVGVLVGAGLALVSAVLVQLFIVPWVDYRRRRTERWLAAMSAFGDWLVRDHRQSIEALGAANNAVLKAREIYDLDESEFQELEQLLDHGEMTGSHRWLRRFDAAHRRSDEASAELTRSMTEIHWLLAKVEVNNSDPSLSSDLKDRYVEFCRTAAAWQLHDVEDFNAVTTLSEAGFDDIALQLDPLQQAHEDARATLVTELRRLLANHSKASGIEDDPYQTALNEKCEVAELPAELADEPK